MADQKTVVRIDADIKSFEDKMNKVSSKLTGIGKGFSDVGKDLTTKVTVPIAGAGIAILKVAGDFEAGMSKVKAISNASGKDFDDLREQAKKLGAESSFSSSQVAEGMQNLASAGFEVKEIMAAMPGMLNLAASGDIDLATASDYASSALRGFGLEADKATHVADIFAKTASATNAGVTDMGEAMKYVAPVAKTLGISIEETASAIGLLSNAGIKGSQAGTTLRTALTSLASPSKEANDLMKELGINAFDSQGKMKPLGDVIGILNDKFKGLTQQQKAHALETIFGKEAMSGMMVLVDQGKNNFDGLTKSLVNADGSAKKMADTMKDNLNGKIEQLKGSVETLAINLGEILIPKVEQVISSINKWVDKFSALSPATQETILKVAGLAAAIPLVIVGIGQVITIAGTLVKAFTAIKTAMATMGIASLANPIGIVIVAIAALVAAFVGLYKTNEDFRNKVDGVWKQIQALAVEVFGYLQEFWNKWGADITAIFQGLWDIISVILNLMVDGFNINFPLIASIVTNAVKIITDVAGGLVEILRGIVDFVAGVMTGDWDRAWSGIKMIFQGVWDTMVAIVQGAVNLIGGIIDGLIGSIQRGLEWVGKLLSGKSQADAANNNLQNSQNTSSDSNYADTNMGIYTNPETKWFAKGAVFSKPAIIGVGEDTGVDEAVIPMSGTHMKPFAEQIAKLMGGSSFSGITQNLNFYNTGKLTPSEMKSKANESGRQLAFEMGVL